MLKFVHQNLLKSMSLHGSRALRKIDLNIKPQAQWGIPGLNSSLQTWNNKYLIPVMLQCPCAAPGPLNRSGFSPPYGAPACDTSEGSNQWDLACATDPITRQVNKRFRVVWVFYSWFVWEDHRQISSVSCYNSHDMWWACTVVHSQEPHEDKRRIEAKAEGVCVQSPGGNGGDAEYISAPFPMIPPWPLAPLEMICIRLNCSVNTLAFPSNDITMRVLC